MRKNKNILVFDVGGTTIRAGLYSAASDQLVSVKQMKTPNYMLVPQASSVEIIKHLFDAVSQIGSKVLQDTYPETISFAFPGPVDVLGNALSAPTIMSNRFSEFINLKDCLRSIWPGTKIMVLNDVTAAGYCYLNRPDEDMCIATVSSGIGHKVFINGRAVVGPNARGGEIGHVRVDLSPDAPMCECGGRGHLASLASGRASLFQAQRLFDEDPKAFMSSAIGRKLKNDIKRINNELIVEFSRDGDSWCIELVQRIARPLGQMLAAIHLTIGIERFVIIGGFALALGELYRNELSKAAEKCSWKLAGDWSYMIELGSSYDNAGLIGAGRYAALFADVETPAK